MPLGQNGRLLAQISLHTPILSDQSLCSLLTKFLYIENYIGKHKGRNRIEQMSRLILAFPVSICSRGM